MHQSIHQGDEGASTNQKAYCMQAMETLGPAPNPRVTVPREKRRAPGEGQMRLWRLAGYGVEDDADSGNLILVSISSLLLSLVKIPCVPR